MVSLSWPFLCRLSDDCTRLLAITETKSHPGDTAEVRVGVPMLLAIILLLSWGPTHQRSPAQQLHVSSVK